MEKFLDIYSDYLICQNQYATSTGLSTILKGDISHDKITRFLNTNKFTSKDLWEYVKPMVRKKEEETGFLIIDDTIQEKEYSKENDIMCWHYSYAKGRHMKGFNILSCLIRYGDISLPIGFEIIKKEKRYFDKKEQREKRCSKTTKNEHFRNLVMQAKKNDIIFKYILADSWFSSKENLSFIEKKAKKKFILGLKSNRLACMSKRDKSKGIFNRVKDLEIKKDKPIKVWLKGLDFPVLLEKKTFKNEGGSTGILFIVTNDLSLSNSSIYDIYQKRWKIEEYHKSIKQNASLSKSPTKVVRSQSNHIFSSIISFCKLEFLKIKTTLNHFALKYKLLLRSNMLAFHEFRKLKGFA